MALANQTAFSGPAMTAPSNGPFTADTTELVALGTKCYSNNGSEFRYCLSGGTALVPGKLQQAPAQVTTEQGLAVFAAAAIGATQVTVTLGGTNAIVANQYAEGWLSIVSTPGQGYFYKIASHPAAALSTNVVLTLADPLIVALTTSSVADMIVNPFSGVIVNPTTATGCVVGVAVYAIPATTTSPVANNYGWLQVKGPCNLLNDSSTAVGLALAPSGATAGAAKTWASTLVNVGYAMQTLTTTDYQMAFLNLS